MYVAYNWSNDVCLDFVIIAQSSLVVISKVLEAMCVCVCVYVCMCVCVYVYVYVYAPVSPYDHTALKHPFSSDHGS